MKLKLIIILILLLSSSSVFSICVTPTSGTIYYNSMELCSATHYLNDTTCAVYSGAFRWHINMTNQTLQGNNATIHGDVDQCYAGDSWWFDKGVWFNSNSYNATIKNIRVDNRNRTESGRVFSYNIFFSHFNNFGGFWVDNLWSGQSFYANDMCCVGGGDPWIAPYTYRILITNSKITNGYGCVDPLGGWCEWSLVNVTNHAGAGISNTRWYVNVLVHDSSGNVYTAPVNITGKWNLWHTCMFETIETIWTNSSGRFDRVTLQNHQQIPFQIIPDALDNFYKIQDNLILSGTQASPHTCEGYNFSIDSASCYNQFHVINNNTFIDILIDPANCPSVVAYTEGCGQIGVCTANIMCFVISILKSTITLILCIQPIFILILLGGIGMAILLGMKELSKRF